MNALILLKYHYKFKLKALRSEKDYLLKIILILFFLGFIVLFTFILKALIPANDLVLLKKIYLPIIGMQVISLINSSGLSGSIYPYLKLPIKKLPLLTLIVFEEILLKKILFITSTLCIALTISTSILLSTNLFLLLIITSALGFLFKGIDMNEFIRKVLLFVIGLALLTVVFYCPFEKLNFTLILLSVFILLFIQFKSIPIKSYLK